MHATNAGRTTAVVIFIIVEQNTAISGEYPPTLPAPPKAESSASNTGKIAFAKFVSNSIVSATAETIVKTPLTSTMTIEQ